MQLTSTKIYGRLVLAVMIIIGLWSAWDTQAGMVQPGWLAGWRSTVWCRTVLSGPEFGNASFFHYPGKKLPRVMDEMGVPIRYQLLYRNAEAKETTCYTTWKEAAEGDILFYTATQDHQDIVADWTEAHYQRALLMLHLQPEGYERLETLVKTERRLNEQELRQP